MVSKYDKGDIYISLTVVLPMKKYAIKLDVLTIQYTGPYPIMVFLRQKFYPDVTLLNNIAQCALLSIH